MHSANDNKELSCSGCHASLDVLITRFECRQPGCSAGTICAECFTSGKEFDNHSNDHPYAVLTAETPILDWSWTATEEMRLLKAIETCGMGNWTDIAKSVGRKTADECELHYTRCYIHGPGAVELDDSELSKKNSNGPEDFLGPTPVTYYPSKTPLRPELGSVEHSDLYAGYCPPRGDFFDEPDSQAEKILNNVCFDNEDLDPIDHKLQLVLVEIYRTRLEQRERTKEIIAEHGLLDASQNAQWVARYANDLGERNVRDLLPLVQIMSADAFMSYMESLKLTEELKRRIKVLQRGRENGLKRLDEITQWQKFSRQREQLYVRPTECREVFRIAKNENTLQKYLLKRCRDDATKLSYMANQRLFRKKKAAPPPLAIENLQGYHKLTQPEKEFCSVTRLIPSSYLNLKSLLLLECRKNEGLRLARARDICNIDVNKTKRLYEFLMREGIIHF